MELLQYLIHVSGGASSAAEVGMVKKSFRELGDSAVTASEKSEVASGKLGMAGAALGKLSAGLGLGLLALGASSVKMSNQFNTEMLKIRTEGGATSKEFNHMKAAVLDMASSGASMGQGPTSLAEGLYHLESMGLRGTKALQGLKLASEEAAISGSNLEDTTTAIGGALFVGMKGTGGLSQMMSTLNAIAGSGNMRFQDLNEALGTGLLSSAKNAGLTLQETGAALGVLTDSGQKASSAGAQLATALHFLYDPSLKAKDALKSINLTGDDLAADLHKPQGLTSALEDLHKHLDGLSKIKQADVLNAILPGGRGRVLLTLYTMLDRIQQKYEQIKRTAGTTSGAGIAGHLAGNLPQGAITGPVHPQGFDAHVMEQQRNPATKLATAHAKLQASMVKLGNVASKQLTPALVWLENAGAKVTDWAVKALPEMVKLTKQGFTQLYHAGKDVWGILQPIGAWIVGAGGWIAKFVSGGMKMFITGWHQLMGALTPVLNALTDIVGLIPQVQLPSLPGGPAQVTGHGTQSQYNKLRQKAGSVGIHLPASAGHVTNHAATNGVLVTGDIHVHLGGKPIGRITREQLRAATVTGA